MYRGFSRQPCWRAEIDLISQRRENVLFFPSNMAAMTSHENDSSFSVTRSKNSDHCGGSHVYKAYPNCHEINHDQGDLKEGATVTVYTHRLWI